MTDSPDLSLTARVPSVLEILGIAAAAVPFVITVASSSIETVNGQVTSFTYRDPVAIAGGAAAALCGIVSAATLLRRTEPAKRVLRIVLCLALVGAGVFHALRGFGIAGIDKPDTGKRSTTATIDPPPVAPEKPAPVDTKGATELAEKIMALWQANKIADLYALSQEAVRDRFDVFDIQHIHDTYTQSFGAWQKLGDLTATPDAEVLNLEGPAVFEKGSVVLELTVVQEAGRFQWRGLTLDIPEEMQKEPDPVDADVFARRIVDDLLANKLDLALFHPRVADRTTPEIMAKLVEVLGKLGAIQKIGDAFPRADCKEAARCVNFEVKGKKGTAVVEIDLLYVAHAWRVGRWNLNVE